MASSGGFSIDAMDWTNVEWSFWTLSSNVLSRSMQGIHGSQRNATASSDVCAEQGDEPSMVCGYFRYSEGGGVTWFSFCFLRPDTKCSLIWMRLSSFSFFG